MAENKQNTTPERRPDCVTEIRMGNSVLTVSGFLQAGRNRHRSRQDDESAGGGSRRRTQSPAFALTLQAAQ